MPETATRDVDQLLDEELVHYRCQAEENQQRLVDFLSITSDITWELDADLRVISSHNPLYRRRNDAASADYAIGKTVPQLLGSDPAKDRALSAHMDDLASRRSFSGFIHSVVSPDGTVLWFETSGKPVFGRDGSFRGYRGRTRDITRHKADEARIDFLSHHDWLTNLPNRVLFSARLQSSLQAMKPGDLIAVLMIDLDEFKITNDTLGHDAGDSLLRQVGERLSGYARHIDTVARVGGDEFGIVQVGVESERDAAAFAARVADLVGQPYEIDGHRIVVSASIGVTMAPLDSDNVDQILRNADLALAEAKASDPGSWRFYHPHMSAVMEARRNLTMELRDALLRNQFELYYQPFFNVRTREITAFEALLRWRHPKRGFVLPDSFIPAAEASGLIVPMGEWVLREACKEAANWPDNIAVSVNLSPVQFKNRTPVQAVRDALSAAGILANRLQLEITESVLIQNADNALSVLHELRDLGARISMDDFGTGYSSLGYLRSFPFDKIKIDRSFIQDITQKQSGVAIVHAIAVLGTSLQLETLAEGIETMEQLAIVEAEGCTEVQGFLFASPQPAENIRKMIQEMVPGWHKPANRLPLEAAYPCSATDTGTQQLFSDVPEQLMA